MGSPSDDAAMSSFLEISPRALEQDFWEGFSHRVWHWQDSVTSGCTVALLPLMWTRTPSWQLGVSYILVYCLKAFHLAALWRAHKAGGRGEHGRRYSFAVRNAFVISERVLRIVASYFVGRDFDNVGLGKLYLLASVPGNSSTIRRIGAALTAVKRLVMGTGTTVALWQAFCQPTVWALEPLLLLPLVVMCLYGRAPVTAAFWAGYPPGSALHSLKMHLAQLCSSACRAALPYQEADSPICELEPSTKESPLLFEKHLIGCFIIFTQYLLPLYFRYVQERSAKQEFLWPFLSSPQKARFWLYSWTRSSSLLTAVMHMAALTYALGISLVLGRLAARYLIPPSHEEQPRWR